MSLQWEEGDYVCYGDAIAEPNGLYGAYYKISGTESITKQSTICFDDFKRVDNGLFKEKEAAQLTGLHYAQYLVRSYIDGSKNESR